MYPPMPQNILLILFDSLSTATCVDLAEQLPTLTQFRGNSLCFPNAYASSPESGPARASLFTGLDLSAHGVWSDGVALPERETTVTERFTDQGYETWLCGRRHLSGVSNWTTEHARPFEFAQFDWAHGPHHRSRQNAYLTWLQAQAPELYAQIFPKQPNPDATDVPEAQRRAIRALAHELSFNSWVTDRICAHIKGRATDQPFFGVAGYVVGQDQGGPPDPDHIGEAVDPAALQQADAGLARILDCLSGADLLQNTTVVVAATRGDQDAGATSDPMKQRAVQTSLMFQTAGITPRIDSRVVTTADLVPTLYDIAKIRPPRRIQGTSLLSGVTSAVPPTALFRLRRAGQQMQTAVVQGDWKLIAEHGQPDDGHAPRYRLYNLNVDPGEAHDLAADPAHMADLEAMIDVMLDARVAREDRTEPRIAKF